jgi:hypothetical protein
MRRNNMMDAYKKSYEHGVNPANYGWREYVSSRDPWTGPPGSLNCNYGVNLELFPPGIASAPFKSLDMRVGVAYNMKFLGGVAYIVQDPGTLALQPELSWGIVDLGKVQT